MVIALASTACGPVVDSGEDDVGDDDASSTGSGVEGGDENVGEGTNPWPGTDTVPDTTSPLDEATGEVPQLELDGEYLLVMSAVIDPQHPFQFRASVVQTGEQSGNRQLDVTLQPLALDVLSTTMPRTPVGAAIPTMLSVDVDGGFAAELGEVRITGAANPITGSDIVATITLDGNIGDGDVWCGQMTGEVTQPLLLDLTGSTFAFVRLQGDELPGDPLTMGCIGG